MPSRTKTLLSGIGIAVAVAIALVVKSNYAPDELTPEEKAREAETNYRAGREEIVELDTVLYATPCDTKAADRRVLLHVIHGQTALARALAKRFLEECGDNGYMRTIADTTGQGRF